MLKNTIYLSATRYAMLPLNMVTSILMARILGPEGVGVFTVMLWLPSILAGPMSFGIGNANLFFGAKNRSLGDALLANSIFLSFAGSFVFITLIAIAVCEFNRFLPLNLSPIFFIVPLLDLPFRLLKMFVLNLFNAWEEHSQYRIVESSQTILYAFFCLFGVFFFQEVWLFIFSQLAASFLACIYSLILIRSHCKLSLRIDWSLLRKSISYGMKVQVSSMVRVASQKLDEVILLYFAGPAILGILALARNIVDKMKIIPYSLGIIIAPMITAKVDSRHLIYRNSVHYSFMLMACITVLLIGVIVPLVPYVYGDAYSLAKGPLILFMISLLPIAVQRLSSIYILSCGNPGVVIKTGFKSACVLVILDLALVPFLGIYGAAIASISALVFDMILLLQFLKRTEHISIMEIFAPSSRDVKDVFFLINNFLTAKFRFNNTEKDL